MTLDEQITLYALGALDERERRELEHQLQHSAGLRTRLAEERTAAALLLAAEPVMPSPHVKQALLRRIDATLASPAVPPAPVKRAGMSDVLRWLFGGLSIAAAAASIVLAIGLSQTQGALQQTQVQVAQLEAGAQQTQRALEQAQTRASQLEQDLAAARAGLDEARRSQADANAAAAAQAQARLDKVQAGADRAQADVARLQAEVVVLSQADARSAALPSNRPGFEQGAVRVFFSPQSKNALITVANLPPLAHDQTYQVWLIKGDQALPSSVFNTAADGQGRLIVQGDELFSAYSGVGITVEPAGGRPTPNPEGPIYLGNITTS